ncbi:hypothetical protein EB796_003910 [Bugula neritina]|uniref:Uncharacterized protein n=1 Tax=Bugula neritina TaxID=10212 RepID=A0A7J7KGR1_BUGNE|nr:hypothetical protein EB796_003910 [Bugula neritina]
MWVINGLYRLWFGHDYRSFLMEELRIIVKAANTIGRYTIERVKQIPEARTATHLILFEQIPPDIHLLFPQVTRLNIKRPQISSLQK